MTDNKGRELTAEEKKSLWEALSSYRGTGNHNVAVDVMDKVCRVLLSPSFQQEQREPDGWIVGDAFVKSKDAALSLSGHLSKQMKPVYFSPLPVKEVSDEDMVDVLVKLSNKNFDIDDAVKELRSLLSGQGKK